MQRKLIGLILAGGQARRFGGGKALAPLKGKPLVFWVKEALEKVCSEVWLSLRSVNQKEVLLTPHFSRIVLDPSLGEGPLSGLLAGLQKLKPPEALLVASCDQPLLAPELLQKMKSLWKEKDPWSLFCVNQEGFPEPFPGIYTADLLPFLEKFLRDEGRSFRKWLLELPPEKVLGVSPKLWYSWDNGQSFTNINSREDLRRLEQNLSA